MRRSLIQHPDRGASAILIALTMVVLMGLAALAVDAGIAFEDRRQQQAAADSGALAALQFARTGLPSSHPDCTGLTGEDFAACRGAEEALDVIEGTLPGRYPDDSGGTQPDWDSCVDSSKPAEYTIASAISDCISFTENLQRARVMLPGTEVRTAFARVIGFNSVGVSAFAEAKLDLKASAEILPFALGPTGAGSNQACLFANPAITLNIPPCDGPDEGNFGYLDMSLYGNESLDTDTVCGNAFKQSKLATNVVVGSDHPLEEEWRVPGTVVNDHSNCDDISNPADQLETFTGNSTPGLEAGLFHGTSSHTPPYEGRLMCKDGDGEELDWTEHLSDDCVSVWGGYPEELDDTPLWLYITSAAASGVPGGVCNGVDDRSEMEDCLSGWKTWGLPTKPALFTIDITKSPRFIALPVLEDDPSNGTGAYLITDFVPAYIETIFVSCSAMTCDFIHSPGEDSTDLVCPTPPTSSCGWPHGIPGTKDITAMSSFILTRDMLDPVHQEFFPGRPGTIIYNLFK